jgi:hypothetical protein
MTLPPVGAAKRRRWDWQGQEKEMRRTLVSGLLLASVAGCIVVSPKPLVDDRTASSRPSGGAAARAAAPGTAAAADNTPATTQSAFAADGPPPAMTGPSAPGEPRSGAAATTAAKPPLPGCSPTVPPEPGLLPASYAEVHSDPLNMSATTLPPAPLPAEHAAEAPPTSLATAPALRMVNSKRFTLNYEVKDAAGGGPPAVDLWCTQDLHSWQKFPATPQGAHACVVDVKDEGTYGFTLVARGAGEPKAPQPGDAPQVWVVVDTTKPAVQLTGLELSLTAKVPSLIVRWDAADHNFGPRPVTLAYAVKPEGPWMLIAENVENTGRYEWPIPPNVPPAMYVRVGAIDLVGNRGEAQTPNPVHLDANLASGLAPADASKLLKPIAEQPPAAASIVNLEVSTGQTGAKQ